MLQPRWSGDAAAPRPKPSPLPPVPVPAKRRASTSLPLAASGKGAAMPSLSRLMLCASRPPILALLSSSCPTGAAMLPHST